MTYREVLPIWWSLTWRAVLAGALAGTALGFLAGAVAGILGLPRETSGQWGAVMGYLGGLLASIWALRAAIVAHRLAPIAEPAITGPTIRS